MSISKKLWLAIVACLLAGCHPKKEITDYHVDVPKGTHGFVAMEPAYHGTDPHAAAVAQACGYYLQAAVAGRPELGQTPPESIRNNPKVFKMVKSLAIDDSDAPDVAAFYGVDRLALGELKQDGSQYVLTIRLMDEPDNRQDGDSFVAKGSLDEIQSQMSSLTAKLAARLGASAPGIGPMNSQLAEAIEADKAENAVKAGVLISRAVQDPLLAIYYDETNRFPTEAVEMWRAAMKADPDNTLILERAAFRTPILFNGQNNVLDGLLQKFEKNQNLLLARARYAADGGDYDGQIEFAQRAAEGSPQSYVAHERFVEALRDKAQSIRKGKIYAEMSEDESTEVEKLYHDQESESIVATKLAPKVSVAWSRLAEAALFAGDRQVALDALKKTNETSGNHAAGASIGLMIYSSQWGGSDEDEQGYADEIASDTKLEGQQLLESARVLAGSGYEGDAKALLERGAAETEKLALAGKESWMTVANIYLEAHQPQKAADAAAKALASEPRSPEALAVGAITALKLGRVAEAREKTRLAFSYRPKSLELSVALAEGFAEAGQAEDAKRIAEGALEYAPRNPALRKVLAHVYVLEGLWNKAASLIGTPDQIRSEEFWDSMLSEGQDSVSEYYAQMAALAVHEFPKSQLLWRFRLFALNELGKFKQSIAEGKRALSVLPEDPSILFYIGYAMSHSGQKGDATTYLGRAVAEGLRRGDPDSRYWVGQAQKSGAPLTKLTPGH